MMMCYDYISIIVPNKTLDSNTGPLNYKAGALPQDQPGEFLSLTLITDSNSSMKGRRVYFPLPSKDDDVP